MKKRILATLLSATMVAAMAVGCSSTTEEAVETTEAATTEAVVEETEATEETEAATEETSSVEGSMEGVTLKVGTSGLFGPFSYYDEDGTTLIGYDIDLLNELQAILGFEIEEGIEAMDYSALTTSLAEGKLDIGAAALCATDERKEVMNFSETYCDSGQVVMVNATMETGITSVEDLAGMTVAVEKGTASHTYASNNLADSTIEVHDTITTAYESLEQGKVDCLLQDGPGAAFYIKTTDATNLEVVGDEFNQGQAPYAVAVSFDCEYLEEIDAALAMLVEDGTLAEIYAKWCE
ncbi:MAG: transporter substrate-binding domain-containing protein [Eubacteriales bacterium]